MFKWKKWINTYYTIQESPFHGLSNGLTHLCITQKKFSWHLSHLVLIFVALGDVVDGWETHPGCLDNFFCSCVTYLLTTTNKTKNHTTFCGTKNINNFCHTSRTAEIFWFTVVFTLKLTSHCCRHQIWRLQYFYFIKKPPKNGTFFPIAKILLFGQKSGAHHFL